MKRVMVVGAFSLLFLFGLFIADAKPFRGVCPIQSTTDVVIYGETGMGGVGTPSRSWMEHFFNWWSSQDPSLQYVFLSKNNVKYDCVLSNYPNVTLYVQPGGNAYYQQNALGSAGKTNILAYLDQGGAYFGACAGAYYAANDYYWQGAYYNWPDLLNRFPTVEGSITTIADYDQSPGYALTLIEASGRQFDMIYYGGPTRGWRDTPLSFPGEQRSTFTGISGGLPASVVYDRMLLTSVHAEAYEQDGITGLTTEQRIENYKWLASTLNDVANTTFFVPPYAAPPACSDTLDNDGDTFIDYPLDVGCARASDDDERDGMEPVTLFSDDFESGSLGGWMLSRASGANDWMIVASNPFEGSSHAESKPQSTSEPASVMRRAVSTEGYTAITFSYARRLVGLDAADEFKAQWFDGSTWTVLEQTGSASANDAGYIFRSFELPAGADNNPLFQITFECTAGAVSEFCRVDTVIVSGT